MDATTTRQSFSGLTQVDTGGHELVVTVTPTEPEFPVQTVQRRFRTGMLEAMVLYSQDYLWSTLYNIVFILPLLLMLFLQTTMLAVQLSSSMKD